MSIYTIVQNLLPDHSIIPDRIVVYKNCILESLSIVDRNRLDPITNVHLERFINLLQHWAGTSSKISDTDQGYIEKDPVLSNVIKRLDKSDKSLTSLDVFISDSIKYYSDTTTDGLSAREPILYFIAGMSHPQLPFRLVDEDMSALYHETYRECLSIDCIPNLTEVAIKRYYRIALRRVMWETNRDILTHLIGLGCLITSRHRLCGVLQLYPEIDALLLDLYTYLTVGVSNG